MTRKAKSFKYQIEGTLTQKIKLIGFQKKKKMKTKKLEKQEIPHFPFLQENLSKRQKYLSTFFFVKKKRKEKKGKE